MKIIFLFCCVVVLAFLCDSETLGDSERRHDNYLTRRRPAESPVRALEQQLAQLSASVAALNANNAEIIKRINDIHQSLNALQQTDSSIQGALNSLRQDLDQTKRAWHETNEKMIEQISREINNSLRQVGTQQSGRGSPGGAGGPIGRGEFYVHTVEAGSTLNAIAKAYGVTVAEIRAANGMANDLIRVGQKLYVPKK